MSSLIKGIRRQFAAAGLGLVLGVQFAHAGNDDAAPGDGDDAATQPNADLMETADGRAIPHPGGRQAAMQTAMGDAIDMAALGIDMRKNHPVMKGVVYRKRVEKYLQQSAELFMHSLNNGLDGNAVHPETGTPYFVYAISLAEEARRPELVEKFLENGADPQMRIAADMPFLGMPSRKEAEEKDEDDKDGNDAPRTAMDLAIDHFLKAQGKSRSSTQAALDALLALEKAGAGLDDIEAAQNYIDGEGQAYHDFALNIVGMRALASRNLADEERLAAMQDVPGLEKAKQLDGDVELNREFLREHGANLIDYDEFIPGREVITYTVRQGDTLWDIARRFQDMAGADNIIDTMHAIAEHNDIALTRDMEASRLLIDGQELSIPVAPDIQPVKELYSSISVLYGVAAEIQKNMEITGDYSSERSLPEIVKILIRENLDTLKPYLARTETEIIPPLQPGKKLTFKMPWGGYNMKAGDVSEIEIRHEHSINGLVHQVHQWLKPSQPDSGQHSVQATRQAIEDYNDIDLSAIESRDDDISAGRSIWVGAPDTMLDSTVSLDPHGDNNGDSDNSHDAYLAVIEPDPGQHHEWTYSTATHTAFKLNADNPDHIVALDTNLPFMFTSRDMTSMGLGDKSNAYQMLFNKGASNIDDSLIFSASIVTQVNYERAELMRQTRFPDNPAYQTFEAYMPGFARNAPPIIQGAGNARQALPQHRGNIAETGMGEFVESDLATLAPQTILVGAAGESPDRTSQDKPVIREYSNAGGEICRPLPAHKGKILEGTSFSTPDYASHALEMTRRYGDKLTFPEIFAATAMTASQDILDYDPFGKHYKATEQGQRATPAKFVTNSAGMAYHGRCGFGFLSRDDVKQTDTLLQTMADMKDDGRDGDLIVESASIDTEKSYRGVDPETGDPAYVYEFDMPADMTLGKLVFMLPQPRFERSSATVENADGFHYRLPPTIPQTSHTRAFSYMDAQDGQTWKIYADKPLLEDAGVYLYGHEDGNVIQAVRDKLKEEGKLYPKKRRLEGDEVIDRLDRRHSPHPAPRPPGA